MGIHAKIANSMSTLEERFKEKFEQIKAIVPPMRGWVDVTESILAFIEAEKELSRQEEAQRWSNQPANEHDNRIRAEAYKEIVEMVKLKKREVFENKIRLQGFGNKRRVEIMLGQIINALTPPKNNE